MSPLELHEIITSVLRLLIKIHFDIPDVLNYRSLDRTNIIQIFDGSVATHFIKEAYCLSWLVENGIVHRSISHMVFSIWICFVSQENSCVFQFLLKNCKVKCSRLINIIAQLIRVFLCFLKKEFQHFWSFIRSCKMKDAECFTVHHSCFLICHDVWAVDAFE